MNSIFSGMSSTTNDTSLMAVNPFSYVFVTWSNRTTGGFAAVPWATAGADDDAEAGTEDWDDAA